MATKQDSKPDPKQFKCPAATGGAISQTDISQCSRSRAEALAEIEREANVRLKCFDRWIADGRLSEVDAKDRMERLVSAWHHLMDSPESRAFDLAQSQREP